MKKPEAPRKRRPSFVRGLFGLIGLCLLAATLVGAVLLYNYASHLDGVIRTQFEGKRWALPARVYARPLEAFVGATLNAEQLQHELDLLRYRRADSIDGPGLYRRNGDTLELSTRGFAFWDGTEASRHVRVGFRDGTLVGLDGLDGQPSPDVLRLEPFEIAGIYPAHHEDRVLVRRQDLPKPLVDALVATEDRTFFEHFGIDLKGVARAAIANLRAGRTVQGASTLTQQLVKNFFLSNERTLTRKLNEMLMAVLIDAHYSKDDILEAYSNEIYLGQDGARAIHGFGRAARFYFDRPLGELTLPQMALMVGLVKGPSYYDPRRHPERAKERRAIVLEAMTELGYIDAVAAAEAKAAPLGVVERQTNGLTLYPNFVDLVQRQLRESYREEDLTSEGLRIFTTLDPRMQDIAEQTLLASLPVLEKSQRMKPDTLQGAVVLASPDNGEVYALVGGRDVRLAGFNRVLDARRPAGSLLKPAVYLAALEDSEHYSLASSLHDEPFTWRIPGGGGDWSPHNYDKRYRGRVMLRDALAKSMNVPTAWIAQQIGMERVVDIMKRLGARQNLRTNPSLVLGAADLTPFEIAQMYQTLASGGFRAPLRAIREVTTKDGKPLSRYPLDIQQVVKPGPAYLIINAMQAVVREGTAAGLAGKAFDRKLGLAGKTGATDDLRDSWFAGFSGNLMALVWVGRDDNQPTGLSGATGALRTWVDLMKQLPLTPLDPAPPLEVATIAVDRASGGLADRNCHNTLMLPFLAGSEPRALAPCHAGYVPPEGYAGGGMDTNGDTGSEEPVAGGSAEPRTAAPSNNDSIGDFFRRLMQ